MTIQHSTHPDDGSARERLLRAGASLFAEKGYAGTSVREIVERAGLTKPALYYHFASKEGLFHAVLQWAFALQEGVLHQARDHSGAPLERLIQLSRYVYRGVMENPDLFRMIHNLLFGPPQGAPSCELKGFHHKMIDAIRTIYLQGQEIPGADPEDVSILVLGLMDFCLHIDHIFPESMDPDRTERLLRLAFKGVHGSETLPRTGDGRP